MKKFIVYLFVLGIINLTYSQVNTDLKEVELESVTVTHLNKTYINRVQDATMSIHVKDLENRVAQFDVTKTEDYDGREESYKTLFRSSKGSILASYDIDGMVLSTYERFNNVKLPEAIKKSIFKDYPDWVLLSDTYTVQYNGEDDVKKIYKVKIGKGKTRKTFRIDFSDKNLVLANSGKPDLETRVSYIEVKN